MGPALDVLRHVWISYFCSPIIQISSFITQIWWVPCLVCFFGFVFSFSFHRPKLTKMSDGWVRMKKKKKCFWVKEIEWWGHFCKYIHIVGPMVYVLSFLCHLTWLPNESMTFSSLIRYQIIYFFFAFFFSLFLFSSQATLFSSYPSAINTTHYSLYPGLPLQLNSSLPSALSLSR